MLGKYCDQLKQRAQRHGPFDAQSKPPASDIKPHSVQKRKLAEKQGRRAEIIVMCSYMECGYWPVARRLRTAFGEIDLVMRRGKTLIAIEVKYRREYLAETALPSMRQQHRLLRALQSIWPYYAENGCTNVHLDIVVLGKWGRYRRFRLAPV